MIPRINIRVIDFLNLYKQSPTSVIIFGGKIVIDDVSVFSINPMWMNLLQCSVQKVNKRAM